MNTANYTRLTNMKAEINKDNKAKFFAQYWGQEVAYSHIVNGKLSKMAVGKAFAEPHSPCTKYLLLTPLSQISEEDALTIAKYYEPSTFHIESFDEYVVFHYYYGDVVQHGQIYYTEGFAMDYLRSKGFAIPFMGLSVEELIEAGWIKLKEA